MSWFSLYFIFQLLFHFTGFTEYWLRNLIFSSEISQVTTEKIFSHLQLRKIYG
jgi:hypothetical protein